MMPGDMKKALEDLRRRYNRREYVHPDPLEFLYRYDDPADREIVALVASSLAYGRVAQILASVESVLERLGTSPRRFVEERSAGAMRKALRGFKHRFTSGEDVAALLTSAGRMAREEGSLEGGFRRALGEHGEFRGALCGFAERLRWCAAARHPVPDPKCGSAMKRLNLFLRWMVRCDDVDPGGWKGVSPAQLIVPLDTHMHRIGRLLGFTERKQADMRTAVEITAGFRGICPEDPVRYDFALTRLGIRSDMSIEDFVRSLRQEEAA